MAIYTDYRKANSTVTDAAAINNAIKNILLTRIGSVPGNPTFGSALEEVLFSQIDYITVSLIKNQIKEALAKWETRISVVNVSVKEIPEYNQVVAIIDYIYRDKGLDINEQISVGLI